MTPTVHGIDPEQLLRITDLELLARTAVEGYLAGMHRSPHTGSSIEFAQYRPYSQGEDLRFIDWKLYGRTDRLHLKQFHEETNMRCTILLDCSASMDYASKAISKFYYSRMLAACLATILNLQKDAVGFAAYDQQMRSHIPPRADRHHLRRILIALDALTPGESTDTASILKFMGEILKPRGMVVLISDLLHPAEEMIENLKSLRARRHDVMVLQISDPAEQTFPFDISHTFVDAEDHREQFAIPDLVRKEYLENRRRHFSHLRRECLRAEIDIMEFGTDEPLDRALRHFMDRRNRALMTSKKSRRKVGA